MDLLIQRLTPTATIPSRGSARAAGLDLFSDQISIIKPNCWTALRTGVAIQLDTETYMRIAPRSGMAYNYGISVLAGVIDSDYRGEIKVILFNHGRHVYRVAVGDRIAQGIVSPIILVDPVETKNDLCETERGAGGFGSTGT